MNTAVFIYAGFMDSGKTTALQGVLLKNADLIDGKSLILCTEVGEIEFDEKQLKSKNIDIVYEEDEEKVTQAFLEEINDKYNPDCVYIEFNGMWDLKEFVEQKMPQTWEIYNVLSLVDAQTYEMYQKNMRQIIMNPLSVSDVILFNRCSETIKKGDIRRSLKILNNTAEVYFARMDGSIDNSLDEIVLSAVNGIIDIDDNMFCPWFVDCIENTDKYFGKKIHTRLMVTRGKDLSENQFYVGRMAAICCAEDAQFIGFVAKSKGSVPETGTWIDAVATIRKEVMDNNRVIILFDIDILETIPAPEDIFLYF